MSNITLSYSSVIDWVLNESSVDEFTAEDALCAAANDPHIFSFVTRVLTTWKGCKLSFGVCCDGHTISADFTPRRHHPLARDYGAFIRPGESITEAVHNAYAYWEAMFMAWVATS